MASSTPSSTLYVGNLPWAIDNTELQEAFATWGATEARIMTDRETGRSRGFGFVTFPDEESAGKAMEAMNNQELKGRAIRLDFSAGKREGGDRPPRSFDREGGGRGGFSGRGGYGGDRDGGRREGGRGGYGGDRDGGRREGGGHSGRRDGSYGGGDHRGHVGY